MSTSSLWDWAPRPRTPTLQRPLQQAAWWCGRASEAVCPHPHPHPADLRGVLPCARAPQDPLRFQGLEGRRTLGPRPLTLASLLPTGSLTSVFVRLPCGGVGVSIPLMCKSRSVCSRSRWSQKPRPRFPQKSG